MEVPIADMSRKTGIPIQNDCSRPDGTWVPATMNGNAKTGSATIAAVLSTDWTVSAVAACATPNPASASMLAWSAVPVAPPPGVMRLNALPASWVVITENQSRVPSAIPCTSHTQAKLASAQSVAGSRNTGWTCPSRSYAENTSAMLGAKR